MKRHRKYLPYVRLANGREKTVSWRMAIRLAAYQIKGKPFYVMVQRGFPNLVIDVARHKRELQRSPVFVAAGRQTFREWAKSIQKSASKRSY